jgi:hypothetical protein
MAPPPTFKKESYAETEKRINLACEAAWQEENPNLSAFARTYYVPYDRFRRRYNGRLSKIDVGGQNKRLTEGQESALCDYLNTLDNLGISARKRIIKGYANKLLIDAHTDPIQPCELLGPEWARRWLASHPEYAIIRKKPINRNRKTASNAPEFS